MNLPSSDPLLPLLPTLADGDRPWLVWYSTTERIELSGHVVAMWAAKIAGFLTEQAPPHPTVTLALPPHWRTVTWALGTWLVGGSVVASSCPFGASAPFPRSLADVLSPVPDVSVAFHPHDHPTPTEVEVLLPYESLAMRWSGAEDLPLLTYDGVADVMTYADHFSPLPTAPDIPALWPIGDGQTDDDTSALNRPAPASLLTLSRAQLATCARERATACKAEPGQGVEIYGESTSQMLLSTLGAWSTGATTVIVDSCATDEVLDAVRRQERLSG